MSVRLAHIIVGFTLFVASFGTLLFAYLTGFDLVRVLTVVGLSGTWLIMGAALWPRLGWLCGSGSR